MKKTVVQFSVQNVSIETVRGRKAIVNELISTKRTLTTEQYKQLKQLQKAQKNLAKLKTQRRKTKSYYAKKSLNEKIKKREMYVMRKFNKTFGIKRDKKTGKFTQSGAGKSLARVTQRGTYQIQAKKRVSLTSYLRDRLTNVGIASYQEFLQEYFSKPDLKDSLREYGVIAHFSQFTGGTSAGWTRRVMDACGIADTITDNEFYQWLIDSGIGGMQ